MTPSPELAPAVGKDIESYCSKCGTVWHVVLTHKDDLVDKTECKECGRKHKYKPTDEEVIAALKEFKKKRAAERRAAKRKTTKRKAATPALPEVVIDESRPLIPYDMKATYEVDDQIDHKTFGRGIVIAMMGPNKMNVNFMELGLKTLLHSRV